MKIFAVLFIFITNLAFAQSDPGATVQTHHETIPNPVFGSTFRVSDSCKGANICPWELATTWKAGIVPTANTSVIVDGNVVIIGQNAEALSVGIYPSGTLSFSQPNITHLKTGEIVVFEGGKLIVGTELGPITGRAEIIIRDLPFSNDPQQHLRGILSINGTVKMHGRPLIEPFLRVAAEPPMGATSLLLESSAISAGWSVGDTLVIPKSSQCASSSGTGTNCGAETEERILTTISPDGKTLTLSAPLAFPHYAARASDGSITFFPHVLNKTRNIIVRSENPNGIRGHVFLHARSDVDIRYVLIASMGRTDIRNVAPGVPDNRKGRYPLHAHHLIGPVIPQTNGEQFTFIGNIIDFGPENDAQDRKWGIAIHGSHYGLIERNIVDRASGAGIVTEDASETGNLFAENFVVRIVGGNGARTEDVDPVDKTKLGRSGVGYWFNGGGGNQFEDNISADVKECVYCYGFKFDNVYVNPRTIPISQGKDPYVPGQGKVVDPYEIGVTHFERNEAYAVPNGLTLWWVCTKSHDIRENCSSLIKDFHIWHHHRWGYFGYETNRLLMDGFVARGRIATGITPAPSGILLGDYMTRKMTITRANIQGLMTSIHTPSHRDVRNVSGPDVGIFTIENSFLASKTNIFNRPQFSTNGSGNVAPQTLIVKNVVCSHPQTQPGPNVTSSLGFANENVYLRNDVKILDSPTCGDVNNVYLMPDYQDAKWCDNSVANCTQDITNSLGNKILKMRAYPLRVNPGPPSWMTPPAGPTNFIVIKNP